tara:strand:- start:156 stop:335 length:180 start_codon:yes stop_codon:yes gene_type:complete
MPLSPPALAQRCHQHGPEVGAGIGQRDDGGVGDGGGAELKQLARKVDCGGIGLGGADQV